jgi:type II secretory pathway pseudopilin PulG
VKDDIGLTLIELVIVLSLLGIVLSVIFTPMLFSFQNFETQNEKANITSNLRATMDHLTRQIRKADTVEVVDNSTINVDSMIYTIDGRNLTKDGNVVIEGIDKLFINENGEGITIQVVIIDKKGEEHSLSSTINIR